MKKSWILLVLLFLSALVLASCTSNADMLPSPSPSIIPMVSPSPELIASPLPSPNAAGGITTIEDARRVGEAVKNDLVRLSEVSNADVVVAGNMALVGIQYDTQYQGGLTDRLRTMIEQRVTAVDRALTVVHVTADATHVQEIQRLAAQVANGQISFAELQTRMLEISARIGGGTPNVANPGVANPGVAQSGVAEPGVAGPGVPGVAQPTATT